MADRNEVLQGTFDVQILKALSLTPMHGGASASGSSSCRRTRSRWGRARCTLRCIGWR